MSCSADLQWSLIKNKGGVGIFQISEIETLFELLWQPSALGGNLTMCAPFLHPLKIAFLSLQFVHEKNVPGDSTERRAYWFVSQIVWMFPILTSRNRMVNIFVIVYITPACKRFLFHSIKAFLLPSIWPGTQYTWTLIWKTETQAD